VTQPGADASRRPRALASLGLLLLVVGAVHLALRWTLDPPVPWGDEEHYIAYALADAVNERTSLLPGTLAFDHRPELASRVFSLLVDRSGRDATFRNVEAFQVVLVLLLVALVWLQARLVGLGPRAATAAGLLVGLLPQQAFHVHSLWPETLHATLLAIATCALLAHLARPAGGRALARLVVAGLALGLALLVKGTLVPFVPVLALLLGIEAWRRERSAARALVPAGVLLAALAAVVLPQAIANARAGHGLRLAANRWWNLELGLTPPPDLDPERLAAARAEGLDPRMERWLPVVRTSRAYFEAADEPGERERLARERTLTHVRSRGVPGVLLDQTGKLARVLFVGASSFEQSVEFRGRWGADPPALFALLVWPARLAWWALLGAGVVGALRRWRAGPGWRLLALLVLTLLAAFFLVPVKWRFFLPALPALVLLALGCTRVRPEPPGPDRAPGSS
jgi:4-amino-4-deoxy-L-arabinose transferase-like glycosyltransferase